ncbi:MAG TPA: CoA transferase, partial [Terriglobales bacterium]|nr:CoA transferase [Terriglobales bacterium]
MNSSETLSRLRVVDLTSRMGGYCGLLLANLGAEVILVEPPDGDPMRGQEPFQNDVPHPEGSLSFAAYHNNKHGIVLDLKNERQRETLRELLRFADVLVEDQSKGTLEQLGLGYTSLKSLNPALVVTSISGFGLSGPYCTFKAPNLVAFAMGGLMNLCG